MSTEPTQPMRPPSANTAGTTDPNATTAKTPAFDPRAPSFQPAAPTAKFPPASSSAASPPAAPAGPRTSGEPGWPEQPPQQGYGSQGYGNQGYRGPDSPGQGHNAPGYGPQDYGPRPAVPQGRSRVKRRRRRWMMALFSLIVLLILLVIGDRVAVAVAESQIASQIKSADSAINPSVNIRGFPFLTQVITRNLQEIDISASNFAAGPVTVSSMSAKAKGVHINGSFNGGKVDDIEGAVSVTFASLSSALSSQSGGFADLKLSDAGNGLIKATFGVLGNDVLTETGKVTIKGNQVNVVWRKSGNGGGGNGDIIGTIGGAIGDATGSGGSGGSGGTLPNLNFTLPKLPAGLQVKDFSVTSQGLTINIAAHNTTLSQ